MNHLVACVSMFRVHAVPEKTIRGCQITETVLTDGWELPCGCWEMNPSS